MRIAAQIGWEVISPCDFTAVWNGKKESHQIKIVQHGGQKLIADNATGNGILNIPLGYVFNTPENIAMWIKGPPNTPKIGASPLEGVVETYWFPFSFSLNWKLDRPNFPIKFHKGESLAQIFPINLDLYEDIDPEMHDIKDNPELDAEYKAWAAHRDAFFKGPYLDPNNKDIFHRIYHDGVGLPNGSKPKKHWTKINMKPWKAPRSGSSTGETNKHLPKQK
jgi:hypothetical protein